MSVSFRTLLDWPHRDKSLFLSWAVFIQMNTVLVWVLYTAYYTEFGARYFSPKGVEFGIWLLSGTQTAWAAVIAWGLWLRRQQRQSEVHLSCFLMLFQFSFLQLACLVGLFNPVAGLVLVGAPMIGFILFDFRRVLLTLAVHLVMVLVMLWLVSMGKIENAPLLKEDPITKTQFSAYWAGSLMLFGVPFVSLVFSLAYILLKRWTAREEEVRRLAVVDTLTGVANRRALFERFRLERIRAQRTGNSLAISILDLDHFKHINDTYGHPVGDAVLQHVARRLQASVRSCDLVGRYGGEEFVVLMPDTDRAGAQAVIERCREVIATTPLSLDGQHTVLTVSASFGVSIVNTADDDAETHALHQADSALYQAKAEGRNRVRFAA